MSLAVTLDSPLAGALVTTATSATTTTTTSGEVPGKFDVALAGRGYIVDLAADLQGFRGEHFSRSSVPVLRQQADTASVPAEQSINRESLWRRSHESWHHGGGQTYFDRADSDTQRFNTSKGVDVWSKWTLSLLPDSHWIRASANTNLRITSAGTHTYMSDGNNLIFTTDPTIATPVFTTVTGTPATPCNWLTTDGYTIYAAYGVNLWATLRGAGGAGPFATTFPASLTVLGYVKGRLMAAAANSIYNIITAGAAPAALFTHPNTDFAWVAFTEGPGFVYAAGYSGTKSIIYKTGIQPDGTALDIPVIAGELPTGETVRSIKGYMGFLIVGTDVGFRVASIDGNGYLTFGALVRTTSPVLNFEPGDRFVWYGLSSYDSISSGLGRMDLSQFTEPLTPAHASDLMHTGLGAVTSISTFNGMRLFTIAGVGFFMQMTQLVPTGTISSGRITYGVGDDKIAMFLDLRHQALIGSVTASLTSDGVTVTNLGTSTVQGTVKTAYPLNAQQTRAEFFEITLTLSAATLTTGPTVTRTTLRSYPAPTRTFTQVVPLLLHKSTETHTNQPVTYDVNSERAFLEGLVSTQQLITFQEGSVSRAVVPTDFDWIPVKRGAAGSFDGTFVITLKEQSQ